MLIRVNNGTENIKGYMIGFYNGTPCEMMGVKSRYLKLSAIGKSSCDTVKLSLCVRTIEDLRTRLLNLTHLTPVGDGRAVV
jgi:hypothetical protein